MGEVKNAWLGNENKFDRPEQNMLDFTVLLLLLVLSFWQSANLKNIAFFKDTFFFQGTLNIRSDRDESADKIDQKETWIDLHTIFLFPHHFRVSNMSLLQPQR